MGARRGDERGFVRVTFAAAVIVALTALGYTHHWADDWRSTVSYGYAHLDNTASQAGTAYHQTDYASANVIWQLRRRLAVGVEGLYGHKQTKDGTDGEVWRATVGVMASIFD